MNLVSQSSNSSFKLATHSIRKFPRHAHSLICVIYIIIFFPFKADEYDSRQNEVVKNEELTYNNHSTRLQSHAFSAALTCLIIIALTKKGLGS